MTQIPPIPIQALSPTEQGVAMLSIVLNKDRAIEVNIAIMRAFVLLREILAAYKDLARKLEALDEEAQRAAASGLAETGGRAHGSGGAGASGAIASLQSPACLGG